MGDEPYADLKTYWCKYCLDAQFLSLTSHTLSCDDVCKIWMEHDLGREIDDTGMSQSGRKSQGDDLAGTLQCYNSLVNV